MPASRSIKENFRNLEKMIIFDRFLCCISLKFFGKFLGWIGTMLSLGVAYAFFLIRSAKSANQARFVGEKISDESRQNDFNTILRNLNEPKSSHTAASLNLISRFKFLILLTFSNRHCVWSLLRYRSHSHSTDLWHQICEYKVE